jgi:hypothetical protein
MVQVTSFGMLMGDEMEGTDDVIMAATRIVCTIVGVCSCFAGICVALTYILSKNMRSHPSFLIVLICICESAGTFHMILGAYNVASIIHTLRLDTLANFLLFEA